MKRIAVKIYMPEENKPANFMELRQVEMQHVMGWKEQNIIEHSYVKEEKDGAILIFKEQTLEEVVARIEALPLFPFMKEVEYIKLDMLF